MIEVGPASVATAVPVTTTWPTGPARRPKRRLDRTTGVTIRYRIRRWHAPTTRPGGRLHQNRGQRPTRVDLLAMERNPDKLQTAGFVDMQQKALKVPLGP